ncbi:MAG TPA: DUF1501 domain-containing protein [Alphaproteobacteria bacterium]|nr:DUF1501 domain-containing protein [Alphaproteobacteria bacterium]
MLPVRLAYAATDRRLVVVVLRGALDGLAAVPAYADPDYRNQRGALALAEPGEAEGALDLDGRFGLHPALGPLHEMYQARELLVVHAVATPYRSRSHFDGQDLLENGTTTPRGASDGWLNRAVALLGTSDRRLGLAVGQTVPLLLRGAAPVGSYAPQTMPELDGDFLARLAAMYRRDAIFAAAIDEGIKAQAMSDEVLGEEKRMGRETLRGPAAIRAIAGKVGKLLAAHDGARIAVIETGGWDTHAQQGTINGRLSVSLRSLGEALAALKEGLGASWGQTTIAVITEFGRTVAINGTGGTDHGTAGIAVLLGGAVNGGRVVGQWPGLAQAQLYDGRDLAPTSDLRAVMKGVLADHLELPRDAIDRTVFPASAAVEPMRDMIRA